MSLSRRELPFHTFAHTTHAAGTDPTAYQTAPHKTVRAPMKPEWRDADLGWLKSWQLRLSRTVLFFLFSQLREHTVILKRAGVLHGLFAGGDVAQKPAHDLAAARLGQGVGKVNVVRVGQGAHFLTHMRFEICLQVVVGRAGFERDEYGNRFTFDLVWPPDRGRFGNARVAYQRRLDLDRA